MPVALSLDAYGGFAGHASLGFYAATLSVEIGLYAAFLVSYTYGTWCILSCDQQKAPRRGLNIGLLVCNTLMFLLATAHLALDARGAMHGFTEGSPLFDAIKFVIYVLETLIGSCFMIYRLYRVYSRRWQVIIVPSVLLFADGVVGVSSTFLGVAGFYMSAVFYSLGLLIDIVCAICILARVLRISRDSEVHHVHTRRSTQNQVWRVVEALVQSTAITCAASMSLVVTFVNSASLGYPTCLNVFPALIALVFSLTVLRIALNARAADRRPSPSADSSASHTGGVASDQRAMMLGSGTMSTAASCGTLAESLRREFAATPSPTRIHISTTTVVQCDLELLPNPKPPGLDLDSEVQGGRGFVLPVAVPLPV
ncbi:hypothetical protein GSI_12319 [Ganoderma sinense ZZ0214-1]|uniref:Uncharacterized protein n=1 Tax=Ganoderma sinense ZZ0214-1 TaxID=1077348 RepID=A0A2G8RYG8_9APHY|nr:hypothetical protein GSI_12319 [Ganoderma sinense ZZ0214-1]